MSTATALVQLGASALDGVRTRHLPGGRAWCIFEGAQLAADPELTGTLSELLRPIAAEVFPCAGPSFVDLVSGPQRLASRTAVAVLRGADGRVGGMVSYVGGEWDGLRCFYAASAFIRPREQGTGLVASGYGVLMRAELVRAPLRPMYAVVRTPNPVAYAAWRHGGRKMGGEVEPRLDRSISDETRRVAIATATANGFVDRLDPATLIVHGAYAGGIVPGGDGPYGARPRSGDAALDAMFDALLGPEDALMIVGKMSLHRAAAMAGDRVLRQRLGRIGGRRRGAITAPNLNEHARVRGPERRATDRRADERRADERRASERRSDDRRGHDRRGHDRRAGDRRSAEHRAAPELPAARLAGRAADARWDGVDRRAGSRRAGDRRGTDRRARDDRRGVERRELERRSGPRRAGADRREPPPAHG